MTRIYRIRKEGGPRWKQNADLIWKFPVPPPPWFKFHETIFRVQGKWDIDRQAATAAMWGKKGNIHTMNFLVLLNNATVASSMLRLALTISGGVNASHWLRLMSWKWADTKRRDEMYVSWTSNLIYEYYAPVLEISRNTRVSFPMFST